MLRVLDLILGRFMPPMPPSLRVRRVYMPALTGWGLSVALILLTHSTGEVYQSWGEVTLWTAITFTINLCVAAICANIFYRPNYRKFRDGSHEKNQLADQLEEMLGEERPGDPTHRQYGIDLSKVGPEDDNSRLSPSIARKLAIAQMTARLKTLGILAGLLFEDPANTQSVLISKDRLMRILTCYLQDILYPLTQDPEYRENFLKQFEWFFNKLEKTAESQKHKDLVAGFRATITELYGCPPSDLPARGSVLATLTLAAERLEQKEGDYTDPLFQRLCKKATEALPTFSKSAKALKGFGGVGFIDKGADELCQLIEKAAEAKAEAQSAMTGWEPKTPHQDDKEETL